LLVSYEILQHRTPEQLVMLINAKAADGWICQGAPVWNANGNCWMQAIVKEEPRVPAGEVRLKEPRRHK